MQWKAAAPALRKARHADIRRQNNALALDSLNSLFRTAIRRKSDRRAAGFVEMYRILLRRPKDSCRAAADGGIGRSQTCDP